jgi:hypothetical protein
MDFKRGGRALAALPPYCFGSDGIASAGWQLDNKVGPDAIVKSLRYHGLIPEEASANIELAKVIPDLPDQIRRELTSVLFLLRTAATNMVDYAEVVKRTANDTPEMRSRMEENLRIATEHYFWSCGKLLDFYESNGSPDCARSRSPFRFASRA